MSEKDFTRKREQIRFTIDGDRFEAAPAVPAEVLVEFANRFSGTSAGVGDSADTFGTVMSVLELVLVPESYERLRARAGDRVNPVEIDQLSDVILWLLEQYGLRPTQPPSSSATGPASLASGTSSMASTPGVVSTSSPSLLTAS
jgi:hypothetical protein